MEELSSLFICAGPHPLLLDNGSSAHPEKRPGKSLVAVLFLSVCEVKVFGANFAKVRGYCAVQLSSDEH